MEILKKEYIETKESTLEKIISTIEDKYLDFDQISRLPDISIGYMLKYSNKKWSPLVLAMKCDTFEQLKYIIETYNVDLDTISEYTPFAEQLIDGYPRDWNWAFKISRNLHITDSFLEKYIERARKSQKRYCESYPFDPY